MWRSTQFNITRTWAHDHDTREVERVTGRPLGKWFETLHAFGARAQGMVRTIAWLRDERGLSHRLAAVLAWNYFNPSTLPRDLTRSIPERHHTVELHAIHGAAAHKRPQSKARVREGRATRAARLAG